MTRPLPLQTLTRLSWLAALRRQGDRQCHGELCLLIADSDGPVEVARVCALGLLAEVSGVPVWWDLDVHDIGALAGLSARQSDLVINLNDGMNGPKRSFAEIADVVGGWFKGARP